MPTSPRLFLWHKWPDEPLIHLHEDSKTGHTTVANETKRQLTSDGFWAFIDRMRKGQAPRHHGGSRVRGQPVLLQRGERHRLDQAAPRTPAREPMRERRPRQGVALSALAAACGEAQRLVGRYGPTQVEGTRWVPAPVSSRVVTTGGRGAVYRTAASLTSIEVERYGQDDAGRCKPRDARRLDRDSAQDQKGAQEGQGDRREHLPPNLAQPVKVKVRISPTPSAPRPALRSISPSCRSTPCLHWRATRANPSTR